LNQPLSSSKLELNEFQSSIFSTHSKPYFAPNAFGLEEMKEKIPEEDMKYLGYLKQIHEDTEEVDKTRKERIDLEPEDKKLQENIEEIHQYQQYLIMKKQKFEAMAWDLKFQKYWGMILTSDNNEETIKYSEYLIDHIGKFRRTATFYIQLIVNELHKPLEKRLLRPLVNLNKVCKLLSFAEESPTIYLINNLIIKITPKSGDLPKMYAKEFLSLDYMIDILFALAKSSSDCNLRVPLSCLVDYKGFRAIVYALIPLNEAGSPVLGLDEKGMYYNVNTQGILKQLSNIAQALNLREHTFFYKGTTEPVKVSLSPLIQIYKRDNDKKMHIEDDEDEVRFFLLEKRREMDFHIYELDYDEDVYYLLKIFEIFPLDCGNELTCMGNLRPEFVYRYNKPLRSDCFKPQIEVLSKFVERSSENLNELLEAKQVLLNEVVPKVTELLDSLKVVPIDSITLTKVFHVEGLNMRYLGEVAKATSLTQVRDLCITEMVARTLKNILNEELPEKITKIAQTPALYYEISYQNKNYTELAEDCKRYKDTHNNYVMVPTAEREMYDELLKDPVHGYLLEIVYDFLNMAFGKDQDNEEFWEQIVFPKAAFAFNYPWSELKKAKLNLNAIFFSFAFHFGIELKKNVKFELGKVEKPFSNQIKDLVGKSKVYKLRNMPYIKTAEKYKDYRNEGNNELALESLRMKMLATKYLDDEVDKIALAEIAEILLQERATEKAIEKVLEGVRLVNPYHAESIRFFCILMCAYYQSNQISEADDSCFKAINALDFHWGVFHTLHITIYSILARLIIKYKENYSEVQNLYKACLVSCNRVLGPNHPCTADVYMDIGRLWLKMGNKDEAMENIEKAYLVYEVSIETSIDKNYELLGSSAFLLGTITESKRRYKEALGYAEKAADIYGFLYGPSNKLYIESLWLLIKICFAMNMTKAVLENCKKLLENLNKDEEMKKMKANSVASIILISTKNLSTENKRKLFKLTQELIPDNENIHKLQSLNELELTEEAISFFTRLCDERKHQGITYFYSTLIQQLCNLYNEIIEAEDNEHRESIISEARKVYSSLLPQIE